MKTIRPGGYPASTLPAHIHVEIVPLSGGQTRVTEIQFADDPRLTPAARERSLREQFVICDVSRHSEGGEEVVVVFRTRG